MKSFDTKTSFHLQFVFQEGIEQPQKLKFHKPLPKCKEKHLTFNIGVISEIRLHDSLFMSMVQRDETQLSPKEFFSLTVKNPISCKCQPFI